MLIFDCKIIRADRWPAQKTGWIYK